VQRQLDAVGGNPGDTHVSPSPDFFTAEGAENAEENQTLLPGFQFFSAFSAPSAVK
jgi:hypothetical protein